MTTFKGVADEARTYAEAADARDAANAFNAKWSAAGGKSGAKGPGSPNAPAGVNPDGSPTGSGTGGGGYGGSGSSAKGEMTELMQAAMTAIQSGVPERVAWGMQQMKKELEGNPYASGGSYPNMPDSINNSLGGYQDKYGKVDAIFQNVAALDMTNVYAQQIAALSARAKGASGGLGSQALDWRYTGENEDIADKTLAAQAAYAKSININVLVPDGTPAEMADRVAQAISRALAQQVVT